MTEKENWFKRKRYGIGWAPGSKKGWITLLAYVVIIVGLAIVMLRDVPENTYTAEVGYFLAITAVITIVFISFGAKRSPTSKWRWGKKDTDNPDEDL